MGRLAVSVVLAKNRALRDIDTAQRWFEPMLRQVLNHDAPASRSEVEKKLEDLSESDGTVIGNVSPPLLRASASCLAPLIPPLSPLPPLRPRFCKIRNLQTLRPVFAQSV
jgi:hypothetical protein